MNNNNQYDYLSALGMETELFFSMYYHDLYINKKGWLAKLQNKKEAFDLDIACALYDDSDKLSELVWYKNLRDESEAICHYGDELRGSKIATEVKDEVKDQKQQPASAAGEAHKDNNAEKKKKKYKYKQPARSELETIAINLDKLPQSISKVALILSGFQNFPLNKVHGTIELKDIQGNSALYVDFSVLPDKCASYCVAVLTRHFNETTNITEWGINLPERPLAHQSMDKLALSLSAIPNE